MNTQYSTVIVNQPYPFPLPSGQGAIAEFLRPSSNKLLIVMPEITSQEEIVLRKGKMQAGLLVKNGEMLFIWQFLKDGNAVLTFDSPFDARVITDIKLYDIENSNERLLIDIHVVDSATKLVRALRSITMPPELTITFLSSVQDQLANTPGASGKQFEYWMSCTLNNLAAQTKMYAMGA
jgi:hypothetical protein